MGCGKQALYGMDGVRRGKRGAAGPHRTVYSVIKYRTFLCLSHGKALRDRKYKYIEGMKVSNSIWSVYILRCADGSLYTGIAKDPARRVDQHNRGIGAKYTRGRTPVELVYTACCNTHGEALRREHAIKKMTLKQKLAMIDLSSG
jgi:putative endonuclease